MGKAPMPLRNRRFRDFAHRQQHGRFSPPQSFGFEQLARYQRKTPARPPACASNASDRRMTLRHSLLLTVLISIPGAEQDGNQFRVGQGIRPAF